MANRSRTLMVQLMDASGWDCPLLAQETSYPSNLPLLFISYYFPDGVHISISAMGKSLQNTQSFYIRGMIVILDTTAECSDRASTMEELRGTMLPRAEEVVWTTSPDAATVDSAAI